MKSRRVEMDFLQKVVEKDTRKLKAKKRKKFNVWHGFAMCGRIGWSVVVPTLLGTALGVMMDSRFPEQFSWTLMFLVLGVGIGCVSAWSWVSKEHKNLSNNKNDFDE
ncbi:MAG: AtpZ/AtpI family protein [Candidatus Riflebacteria bacterium]|nr:AtpZ/AtpI family protein [Candidatus Riflebacteria bacterium]